MINSVIGSGIFGLPAIVAADLGRESPFAYLVAAAGIGIIMACFAEVASQFRQAGGPYLYTRVAFGRLLSLEVAWLHWLSRLTAGAAAINLFATYLGYFWSPAQQPLERALLAAAILLVLTGVNLLGVKIGAHLSSAFTIAKSRFIQTTSRRFVLKARWSPCPRPATRIGTCRLRWPYRF